MWQNIKSSYFIKLIYTFVEEIQKLKLVRYNKSIQKNLDISIINYKFFSGRYIIYESKRLGKEYNGEDDRLLYEGEYLNGKRIGKGKEYSSYGGELFFEGEYLNGKRNGKRKEYNFDGKLEFEGEYLINLRWKGKQYDEEGNLKFEGKYLNEKKMVKEKDIMKMVFYYLKVIT